MSQQVARYATEDFKLLNTPEKVCMKCEMLFMLDSVFLLGDLCFLK